MDASSGAVAALLFRRQGAQAQGVDLSAHAFAQRGVHHLVTDQGPLAGEFGGNHQRLEVRVVLTRHLDFRRGQTLLDEASDFGGLQGWLEAGSTARRERK